jgi:hypothetical protein
VYFPDTGDLICNILGHVLHASMRHLAGESDLATVNLNFYRAGVDEGMKCQVPTDFIVYTVVGSSVSFRPFAFMLSALMFQ